MLDGLLVELQRLYRTLATHGLPVVLTLITLGGCVALLATRRRPPARTTGLEGRVAELVARGEYIEAGELWASAREYHKALALFLQSGNAARTAECYVALRQPGRAARIYADMGRWAEASHYFQAATAWREAAECVHRLGHEREAAELYERAGELAKAANLLRSIGDLESAARLFERAGLGAEAAASLLRARGRSPATLKRAGELFEKAGEVRRAAECFASAEDWQRAGELFEEARSFSLAGQAFERAGRWDRAGTVYEKGEAFYEARANYERAGDAVRAANVAVRMGSLLDAAQSFYRIGSYERAIETLQSIRSDSPQSREAQILLARIFIEKGLSQRALDCLLPVAPPSPAAKEDAELLFLLADVHERAGNLGQAAEILEEIVAAHPDHGPAGERLDALMRRSAGDPTGLGAVRDHRYELRGEIGRGGMGVVYLAHDRELGRPVAVKFLPELLAGDARSLEMFRAEARAAGAMNHPNIIHIYDGGSIAGRPCIVMEYVPGRTVRELMKIPGTKRKRALPSRRVAEIVRVVARALDYAHGRGVIHRDVKPANILISETGQPKLMDFGISKVLEAGEADQTRAKGTPQYMAPEQILGRTIDGRVDVYALGISMFEMLTGRRPFLGEDVVDQQLNSPLPDPRGFKLDVPDALVAIVERACQKNADDRYASAGEMAAAVGRFLEASPAPPREPDPVPPKR